MKPVSRIALGVAIVLGAGSMVATAPAEAKKKKAEAPAAQPGAKVMKFSPAERTALQPVQTAITAKNWAGAAAALPAAEAAAQSEDAKYAVARFRFEIGIGLNDVAMQAAGIDALIASGQIPTADLVPLYTNQGVLASNSGNKQKAETAFAKVVELNPGDPQALINLATIKNDLKKAPEAVALIQRAIDAKKATGQPVEENWYKFALKLAFDGRMGPQSMKLSRELVAAYPTKENTRDAMLIYRDLSNLDAAAQLDLLRFLRVSGSLAGERDWFDLVDGLYKAGNFAEAKAVLDDGTARKMIDPRRAAFAEILRLVNARMQGDRASLPAEEAKATAAGNGAMAIKIADAWAGYKDYSKAIPLYRAALTKGGVDANLVNTRLGMALLASGDRAGAEAAFRAVTGARADLAGFWLAWLSRPGA
jgi:tetratricopeptide (TPR) repeat protein